jgi:hypothetical protein
VQAIDPGTAISGHISRVLPGVPQHRFLEIKFGVLRSHLRINFREINELPTLSIPTQEPIESDTCAPLGSEQARLWCPAVAVARYRSLESLCRHPCPRPIIDDDAKSASPAML